MGAAALGRLDLVQRFFDAGRNLKSNTTKAQMQSAFMWACEDGRSDVVEFLLEQGAHLGGQNENELTGLHLAAVGGHMRPSNSSWNEDLLSK